MFVPSIIAAVGFGLMTIHKLAPERLPEWPAWLSWTIAAFVWAL